MKELKDFAVGLMSLFVMLTMMYGFFYNLLCSDIPESSRYKCEHIWNE